MSPSIRTMGFFMSEINFCNTKEQLNHLGEVVTGKVDGSPSGADIDTSILPYTGQVRKTLPALEGEYEQSIADKETEADAAIDAYRLLSKGPYSPGITLEDKFQYVTYNGESYFAVNPPYTTTATTPDVDGNLFAGAYLTEARADERYMFSDLLDENASAEVSTTELVTASGWVLGSNWSGDYNTGFIHTPGSTEELELEIPSLTTGSYEVTWRCVSPSDSKVSNSGYTITLGGSGEFEMYEGNFFDHRYNRGIRALTANTKIIIKPENQFDGTLTEISVKRIVSNRAPTAFIKDSNGDIVYGVSPTKEELNNVFIGKNNALKNTVGKQSVGIGYNALLSNTTGFWNVAVGEQALAYNTVGSRNIALGYVALTSCVAGHRNIALGSFAMKDTRDGHNNIGIGADVMQNNLDGYGNVAIGLSNCASGTDITGNVAIGYTSMVSVKTNYNVSVGFESGYKLDTGSEQIAIGRGALRENTAGIRNLVVGNNSFNNVAATDPQRNVVIGSNSMVDAGNCDFNTIIGNNAGSGMTSANSCIIIGYNVTSPSATSDFRLNIGNLIYGRMAASEKRIGINVENPLATLHLPASDGSVSSAPLRMDAGVLLTNPADGTVEYDGTSLYFTDNTNTRRTISFT